MAETETFKNWHKAEVARRLGQAVDIDKAVDAMLAISNLKIETFESKEN